MCQGINKQPTAITAIRDPATEAIRNILRRFEVLSSPDLALGVIIGRPLLRLATIDREHHGIQNVRFPDTITQHGTPLLLQCESEPFRNEQPLHIFRLALSGIKRYPRLAPGEEALYAIDMPTPVPQAYLHLTGDTYGHPAATVRVIQQVQAVGKANNGRQTLVALYNYGDKPQQVPPDLLIYAYAVDPATLRMADPLNVDEPHASPAISAYWQAQQRNESLANVIADSKMAAANDKNNGHNEEAGERRHQNHQNHHTVSAATLNR